MRAIDTNVLVRLIARDDDVQAKAADAFVAAGAWVSLVVLVETVWVLDSVYARTPIQLAKGIEMLLDHESMVVQDADLARRAVAVFRKHPSVGFSDCLIVELARRSANLPLGTFDRSLSRIEGTERIRA